MSLLRTVPRVVVGTTLKVARIPLDTALKLSGRDRSLAADAAEAAVKDAAAEVTGDTQLKAEATAQRVATDERRKAETLRSAATQAKASYQHDAAGQPYRSFRGLIEHLATLTRNQVRYTGTQVTIEMLTEPTSTQRQAFELIGAPIPLTLT